MFGYLRFFLALLVLLSHVGVRVWGLNPGVFAVVIFYILAGYVTTYLFYEVMPKKNRIVNFYIDRAIRIFPLYLIVLSITLLFILVTNYGEPHFNLFNTLSNLTIIPLNYYMYFDVNILTDPKWPLIPPAWSLGTELQAYLLMPLLLLYRKLFIVSFITTFTIYTLANFTLLHPDHFGYRLIFGVLFFFLIGVLLRKRVYKILIVLYLLIFFEAFLLFVTDSISQYSYSKETLLGLLLGMPLIGLFSQQRDRILNKILGRASYALFLIHFLFIWLFNYLGLFSKGGKSYILSVVIASVIASLYLIKIEKMVIERLRILFKAES